MATAQNNIAVPRVASKDWSKTRAYWSRAWPLYAMLLIPLVPLLLFSYFPMYGMVIAFQKYNPGLGFFKSPWVGLANFQYLIDNPDFKNIVLNSLIIAVSKIISLQVVAIAVAVMLNEVRQTLYKRSVQTVLYLPHFLSWVVMGGILIDMLSSTGLVNQTLVHFGIKPILFLGDNTWFRPVVVVTNLWKEMGWTTIIYLAALTGIDPQLHEAAAIDGATRWQRIWNINIPGIASMIILVACLNLGSVLQAGFEQILTLYNPGVYQTGDILDTYVYRAGLISARYSLGAAIGMFQSLMGFLLIVIAYRLAYKLTGYRIF